MSTSNADVVICGAGIAGITSAHALTVRHGIRDVVLIDERPPLTLTSDKSTEAYRNWWPGPDDAMIRLMNRSIDLLEELADESENVFQLNRRGYVYATANQPCAHELERQAMRAAAMGAGPVRIHDGSRTEAAYVPHDAEGYSNQVSGVDLLVDPTLLRKHFPYLSANVCAALHTRRCGWFSGQQLGMYLLEKARENGARIVRARVVDLKTSKERLDQVVVQQGSETSTISTRHFVNAAGPFVQDVAALIGVDLPIFSECHLKASFSDHRAVLPREAPLLIWEDPQELGWSDEENQVLRESEDTSWLLQPFPASVHTRPEGGSGSQNILVLWPYHVEPVETHFPIPEDPMFAEIALRGICRMVPGLQAYLEHLPKFYVDGGYYTKTRENRFLSCPLPVAGTYMLGALSGYGLMAACGAAELLAAHVTGAELPSYAAAFALERYRDPDYLRLLEDWGSTGQL